jgi:SAM-dependent methyltransferase
VTARRPPADVVARTAAAYARQAEKFLGRWGRMNKCPPLLRELLAVAGPRAALLDLGCGAGQDTRRLLARRYHAIGIDRTWPLLTHARRRSPRAPLVHGDMRALPFKPGSFGAIWAAASLMHLPRTEAARLLRALRRMVPAGGLLAGTVAHGRRAGFLRRGWLPGRYFARWRKPELERAVLRAGWTVLSLETVTGRERKGRWLNLIARRARQARRATRGRRRPARRPPR